MPPVSPQRTGRSSSDVARTARSFARRRSAVHAYKREWIVDAARAVFARDGIGGASMREIAKGAGYTVGVIYNCFRSKEELYAEVLSRSLSGLAGTVSAAADGAGAGERSAAALRALHGFYAERPDDFDRASTSTRAPARSAWTTSWTAG